MSIGSVLQLLVLKNDADCTSQRLKRTSGGRDMIIVDACTMIIVHACTMIIVHACTTIIVHARTMIIVHACTMLIVHACTMIIVHACNIIKEHVSYPARLMFREIERGGSGGEAPQLARAPRDAALQYCAWAGTRSPPAIHAGWRGGTLAT